MEVKLKMNNSSNSDGFDSLDSYANMRLHKLDIYRNICACLVFLSVLTLIVDIVITAIGLLSTLGGVLSIGIPIVAIIFFIWLALKIDRDFNRLSGAATRSWAKQQPQEPFMTVRTKQKNKKHPPDSVDLVNDGGIIQ